MDIKEIKNKIAQEEKVLGYKGEYRIVKVKEVYEEEKKNQTKAFFKTGIPTIDCLMDGFKKGQLIVITGLAKRGKCYAKGTKIILSNGKTELVENIKVGDKLMGDDSTPRNVLALGRGKETMYKIIPSKGSPFKVNESHILSLKKVKNGISSKGKRLSRRNKNNVINISVGEYLTLSKEEQSFYSLYRVPLKFDKKILPVDPYFIGLWLGDGNSRDVRISCNDEETTEWLKGYAKKLNGNIKFTKQKKGKCPLIGITFGMGGNQNNKFSLQNELNKLNLLQNKHIPHIYKTNTRKNRLKLLAGLIDSDGNKNKQRYEFCNKNKTLIEDVIFVCRSLGFSAYKNKKIVNGELYFVVHITGNLYKIPVKISRKKIRKRKVIRNGLLIPFTIEKDKKDNYYGFELDGNHLHVLGNFFVSHNTTFAKTITKNNEKKVKILWFSFEEPIYEFYKDIDPCDFYVPKKNKPKDMGWLKERIIESKTKYDTDVVFIDHLHYLFNLGGSTQNISLLVGDLMRDLKSLAVEYGLVIFVLAHTKKVEGNRIPRQEDVRDSALIANECDKMFVVHRDRTDGQLGMTTMSPETKIVLELDRQNGKNMGSIITLDFKNNLLVSQQYENTKQTPKPNPAEKIKENRNLW